MDTAKAPPTFAQINDLLTATFYGLPMHGVFTSGGELWLALQSWDMLSQRVRNSVARRKFKDVLFCAYICLNTLALYCDARFRFPANWRYDRF